MRAAKLYLDRLLSYCSSYEPAADVIRFLLGVLVAHTLH